MLVYLRDRSLSDKQKNNLMIYQNKKIKLKTIFGDVCKFNCNKSELKSYNKLLEAAKVC